MLFGYCLLLAATISPVLPEEEVDNELFNEEELLVLEKEKINALEATQEETALDLELSELDELDGDE